MNFKLSKHAEEELVLRQIPRAFVDQVLHSPEQIIPQHGSAQAYQSRLDFGEGKILLLRIIVNVTANPAIVVTLYRTSKIKKYWREP